MSPNSSSSSSSSYSFSSAAMDGVSPVSIMSQETSQRPSHAPTNAASATAGQQVINKAMLPLKSCLARSPTGFQSQSASTATRPALCELHGSSSRLNDNHHGDDTSDDQAQRHHVDSRHRQNRQRRRLTFNNRTRIYLIPTIEELTTGEYAATYRTPDDDTVSQGEIIRTIQAMAQHNFHDGDALPASLRAPGAAAGTPDASADELTTRGLEHMRSSAHIKDRKETKLMVTDAILTEQEEQWDCGRTVAESEDDIADVSRAFTSRSVQEALERGAKDAAYVRRVVAHDLLCQQQQQLGHGLDNLSLAADLPLASDTTSTVVPHQPTLNQAAPSPWSVASKPTTNTTNALLDQIASNASTATMSNKNKMPSTTSVPAAPTLPPATTYLSRPAPI